MVVKKGDTIAITGESGSGKSSLIHILGGLDKPDHGKITFKNICFNRIKLFYKERIRSKNISYICQLDNLLPEFNLIENVSMPLIINRINPLVVKKRAHEILRIVGLDNKYYFKPHQISGGEKQRIACARAIINKPDCILADEPTGSLDTKNKIKVIKILKLLNKMYQTTIILVTHDSLIPKFMEKHFLLKKGMLIRKR